MTFREWRTFFRTLKHNPIYQREAGLIGEPNPFYNGLRKYAFFFFLAALVLGACGGVSNRSYLLGLDPNAAILWGMVCIPAMLISMVTLYGLLMAPALTAPALRLERDRGTWDILRLTPQPVSMILVAKVLGGLRRLGIWKILLVLTAIEGLVLGIGGLFTEEGLYAVGLAGGLTAVIRPWIEILFSAALGMYLSTWVGSASVTLALTYGGLLLFRMFNNTFLWMGIWGGLLQQNEETTIALGLLFPTLMYVIAVIFLGFGIIRRANKYG
ncbi:MAG: hypothetical protein AAF490_22375 [Chloroflexota bacterium]